MPPSPRRVAIMLDLQWPYKRHAAVFAGTQRYAKEAGWHSILDEYAHHTLPARRGVARPYDGVIARANRNLVARAARLGVPVVNVWQSSPARRLVPGAFPDSRAAGRLIAEHLMARGFRSFATLTSHHNVDQELEVGEIVRVLGEAGFACRSQLSTQNPWMDFAHWRQTQRVIARWMDGWRLPIGVYVGAEAEGRMVVQECTRRGWRVPADVALVAGKNEEVFCEHPSPSLTSVEMGYERIGYEAARLLDRLMDGRPAPVEPIRVPPKGLVVRESTDFFAVDDPLVAAALAFIAGNSHRGIGPDSVASAVGAETRTLQNRFRKSLGRPIATEIRRTRIERAKRELAQSERPIKEIALAVGFRDAMRLYDVFRRELGVTPREYRSQRQLETRVP